MGSYLYLPFEGLLSLNEDQYQYQYTFRMVKNVFNIDANCQSNITFYLTHKSLGERTPSHKKCVVLHF